MNLLSGDKILRGLNFADFADFGQIRKNPQNSISLKIQIRAIPKIFFDGNYLLKGFSRGQKSRVHVLVGDKKVGENFGRVQKKSGKILPGENFSHHL